MPDSNDVAVRSTSPQGRAELAIVLLMMLMSAVLSFRVFFPHLRDIVIFDESYYIDQGQSLLRGELPRLAENPLVAGFWAAISLPFRSSPFWMMHAYGLGRFIVFGLLWSGMYAVARTGRRVVPPLLPPGLLLVTPSLIGLLDNSSDGLFAALAAFALSRFIRFLQEGRTLHCIHTSVLLGLAALARNDGLVLVVVAMVVTAFRCRGRGMFRTLAAMAVPAGLIMMLYAAAHALATGGVDIGLARRSYDAFEQGEGVAYYERYGQRNPYVEGYDAARRLYGTPEENGNSIIRAITRDPRAFGARVVAAIAKTPAQATAAYGRGLRGVGALLLLLALRGGIELWRRGGRTILVAVAAWCGNLPVYALTFFREGYFLLSYSGLFLLAATGTVALFREPQSRSEKRYVLAALIVVITYSLLTQNELLLWPAIVALLALLAFRLAVEEATAMPVQVRTAAGVGVVLLVFAVQVQFSRPARLAVPSFPILGSTADEMAARFLAQTHEPGTPVASYTIAPIAMARMKYVAPHIEARWVSSPEALLEWMAERNVQVVYVDDNLRLCEPTLWDIIRGLVGTRLQVAFHAEDEDDSVDVLIRTESPPGTYSR